MHALMNYFDSAIAIRIVCLEMVCSSITWMITFMFMSFVSFSSSEAKQGKANKERQGKALAELFFF